MKKIQLITDDASDLTAEEYIKYNIEKVNFTISDDQNPEGRVMTTDELYADMLENPKKKFKTACPSTYSYFEAFEKAILADCDVICMTITSKFSGSYNSALVGRDMALEKYPNARIEVVDSACNAVCYAMQVLAVKDMINDQLSLDTILEKIRLLQANNETDFVVGNLDYLRAGGRIGALKSIVANTFNIKPIIIMKDGDIVSGGLGLGIKNTLNKALNLAKNYFSRLNAKISDFIFTIGYGSDKKMGEDFLTQVKTHLNIADNDISLRQIGGTTGVHTGPIVVGVGYMKKYKCL